jgi:hypothetical protein
MGNGGCGIITADELPTLIREVRPARYIGDPLDGYCALLLHLRISTGKGSSWRRFCSRRLV